MFYTCSVLTELIYIIMLRFWGIYEVIILLLLMKYNNHNLKVSVKNDSFIDHMKGD